ncbi:MAG: hypothetical protein IH591_13260, partial [Bacteroidales bacterium]|nr:hypothetical protein [Bacteroidales bacterium]
KHKVICFNKPLRRYYTTETGIMQHELKRAHNPAQDRVNLKYYLWLNTNFGLYILIHSPKKMFESIKIVIKSMIHLVRS